jgi:hypothetical protein
VLISGVLVLVAALVLALGFSFMTFLSYLYTVDPAKYEAGPIPLFPISSIHDRIFAKKPHLPTN